MSIEQEHVQRRPVLVVDDNPNIQEDIRRILCADNAANDALEDAESDLFGDRKVRRRAATLFEVDGATQGEEAVRRVKARQEAESRYCVAFVDVRMPPGLDGIQTVRRLWEIDPELQVVVCTAHSDYTWEETVRELEAVENFLILKKPFDPVEVRQLAQTLVYRSSVRRRKKRRIERLKSILKERNTELRKSADLCRQYSQRVRAESAIMQARRLESIGRLAAGFSHEINNPLSIVMANLQLALEEIGTRVEETPGLEETVSLLEEVRHGGERIRHLIKNLKIFCQQEEGRTSVDLRDALEDAVSTAGDRIGRDARLEVDIGEVPRVRGTRSLIEQLFSHLLTNAAQAIPRGKAADHPVRIEARSSSERKVRISVTDHGVGIPPEHLDLVFDPFFTTRPPREGPGLGLFLCHRIVATLGGEISISSEPGEGTTVSVLLPQSPGDDLHQLQRELLQNGTLA